MKSQRLIASLTLFGTLLATTSQAATYSWNFATSSDNGDVVGSNTGTTNYKDTSGTYSMGASAYTTSSNDAQGSNVALGTNWAPASATQSDLWNKFSGTGNSETGLGIKGDGEHEIGNNQFVQLQTGGLRNQGFTDLKLTISSVQQGEGFYLWGSNGVGTPGTLLYAFNNPSSNPDIYTIAIGTGNFAKYSDFSISADGGNVLIQSGLSFTNDAGGFTGVPNTTNTPEPGTLATLASLGITGIGFLKRRRNNVA